MKEKKKIYIADDEANIRVAIKAFLENAGYTVRDFENGDALFAAFNDAPADLVVLDVMMPGSNGFAVCKKLRKISAVPVILLTARDSDLDYATGLDMGGDDYLVKPFSPMALVMRVKAIFRRMELDRRIYSELDLLTGLYDRVSGENRIESKLDEGTADASHALFFVNIDGYTDEILLEISEAMPQIFGKNHIACRFGRDEFLVLATNISSDDAAAKKAEELITTAKAGDNSIRIGVARWPHDGSTYKELLNAATQALAT